MKNQLIKGFLCVAAATFLSNSVLPQTAVYAAERRQVQKVEDEKQKGTAGTKIEGAADTDGSDHPSGLQAADETEKSVAPDEMATAEGTETPENPQKAEGSEASADQQKAEGSKASADQQKAEGAQEPADQQKAESTGASADQQEAEGAQEPADQQEAEGAQEPADTQSSEEPGESVKPQHPQNPDKEKPEDPKLGKPVLKAASKPNGTIRLNWNKVSGASEYVLLCSTKKDSGFHRIFSCKKGTSYKDPNRVPGKVYYYRLAVFSEGRASRADSKIVFGRPLEKAVLTNISNVSGSGDLVLTWNPVAGAKGYQILRKNVSTGKYEEAGSVKGTKTSYTDHGRSGGTIYSYKVYAKDDDGGRGNYSRAMSQMAIDSSKKMIALTYDDGPSAYTPIVLDALAKYSGHATFFVVGSSVDRYADSLRRAVALGCEIGNHTYNHSNLKNLSAVQVQSALQATSQAVKKQTGAEVRLLRPPYGSYNASTSASAGMPVIMWSVDTLDWKTRSTSATIQCVQHKAYDGAIILMHDLHQPTAMAADAIMKSLTDAGYQLVTVSELAAYRGGLQTGMAYSQFRRL